MSSNKKIFIGGLGLGTTEAQIHDYFVKFGKIENKELFISRGFCYVTYAKPSAAEQCVSQQSHQLNGKWVEVKRSYPPSATPTQTSGKKGSSNPEWGTRSHSESTSKGKGAKKAKGWNKPADEAAETSLSTTNASLIDTKGGSTKPTTVIAGSATTIPVTDSRCKELCGMGFSLRQVLRVLPQCGWDVNMALDKLLIEGIEVTEDPEPPLPNKKLGTENNSTASGSIDDDDEQQRSTKTTTPIDKEATVQDSEQQRAAVPKGKGKKSKAAQQTAAAAVTVTAEPTVPAVKQAREPTPVAQPAPQQEVTREAQSPAVQVIPHQTVSQPEKATTPQSQVAVPKESLEQPEQDQSTSVSKWGNASFSANSSVDEAKGGWGETEQSNVKTQTNYSTAADAMKAAVPWGKNRQEGWGAAAPNETTDWSPSRGVNEDTQQQVQRQQQQGINSTQETAAVAETQKEEQNQDLSGWDALMSHTGGQTPTATEHQAPIDHQGFQPQQSQVQQYQSMQMQQQQQTQMDQYSQYGQGNSFSQGQQQTQNGQYQQQYGNNGSQNGQYYNSQYSNGPQQGQYSAQQTQQQPVQQPTSQQPQTSQQQQQQQQQQSQQQQSSQQQQVDSECQGVIIQPVQAYHPENSFSQSSNQQFLKINEDLNHHILVILYNSNNSGWSFGRCLTSGNQGWFPTSCANFDVVQTMYAFDTRPENTRQYIQFQPSQRIVVQKRHECGWWIGSVIEDNQHGNLGQKGYFPGNYCQDIGA